MGKRGIIGNWQQTKYVSRETSLGRGRTVTPYTTWDTDDFVAPIYEASPTSNIYYSIYNYAGLRTSIGDLRYFQFPDRIPLVSAGMNSSVFMSALVVSNVQDNFPLPDEWEQGIIQRAALETYEAMRFRPPYEPLPGYVTGDEPLSNFTVDDGQRYFYTQSGQTSFIPEFKGELLYGDTGIGQAPAPYLEPGVANTIRTGQSFLDGRSYVILDWTFIFEKDLT